MLILYLYIFHLQRSNLYLFYFHILKAFVNEDQKQDLELPLVSLDKIVKATNNFSINNKLGQGGFGAVYKVNTLNEILYQKNKLKPCTNGSCF